MIKGAFPNTPAIVVRGACLACAVPWLNPFVAGPSAATSQWLVAALLVGALSIACELFILPDRQHTSFFGGFVFIAAVSGALILVQSWVSVFEWMALAGGICLVILGATLIGQITKICKGNIPLTFNAIATSWAAAAVLTAIIGLIQYFGHANAFGPFISFSPTGEAFGNLRQRNQFASLMNIGLASTLILYFSGDQVFGADRDISDLRLGPSRTAAAVALLAVANAASASRTGLLQLLVVAIAVSWYYRGGRALVWVAFSVLCYIAAMLALPLLAGQDLASHGMFARLQSDAQCSSRLVLWRNVLHLIALRPWFGWGIGELDYAHFITLYEGLRFCEILDNAHNLPLQLAVEFGLPIAMLFCFGVLWWVLRTRPWRVTNPMQQLAWVVIGVIALHSALEYPLWYAPFQIALGLSLGMIWTEKSNREREMPSRMHTTWVQQFSLRIIFFFLVFATSTYAAWDYARISQIYLEPAARTPRYRVDTLAKIHSSWLFRRNVEFAELTTATLGLENGQNLRELALDVLHFSPEARVVEILITVAAMLGREEDVDFYSQRYRAAFPAAYQAWIARPREARF